MLSVQRTILFFCIAPSICSIVCISRHHDDFSSYNNAYDAFHTKVHLSRFPDTFQFGATSASYQVEGGWDADGKGENIWDRMTHSQPDEVFERQNGDVAADSYHKYKEDVQMVKHAGLNFYRFSISWSRVMPNGDTSLLNEPGLQYYDNLINELLANNIEPVVTMYHWDLPQPLQEIGGMTNPDIVPYFVQYANVLFNRYGNRVKRWITFNEPLQICELGYGSAIFAPQVKSLGIGNYLCSHHVLLANARIYDLYQQSYKHYNGRVGITINCPYSWPKDATNSTHVAAADRALQFTCGCFTHPIFSRDGGYPQVMIDTIDRRSFQEGRAWSRLPVMSDDVKRLIRGKADFLGLNYFTSSYSQPAQQIKKEPSFENDQELDSSQDPSWPQAKSTWLRSVPQGLRGILNWIRLEYGNPEVIITQNGWSDDGELYDQNRIAYLMGHLGATLDAINDGCNVRGHTTWSIMDNFGWNMDYSQRFGIYHVNFDVPERTRTPKASVSFLRKVIRTRVLPK